MIELNALTRTYGNSESGIFNISGTLKTGKIYGIVGENGAGKTTLLKTISGILNPDSGSVIIDGYESIRERKEALTRIGFMPDGIIVNSDSPIIEMLAYYGQTRGLSREDSMEKATVLLARFGIDGRLVRSSLRRMSLGQKRRSMLAMSLMNDPMNILMDEPYNGFDPDGMRMVNDVITFEKGRGKTVIVSSHILKELESIADEVIFISNGKINDQIDVNNISKMGKKKVYLIISNADADLLGLLEGYGTVRQIGNQFEISLDSGNNIKPEQINSAMVKSGYEVSSIRVENPSLEDIYFSKKK